jgi:hypothetical protein
MYARHPPGCPGPRGSFPVREPSLRQLPTQLPTQPKTQRRIKNSRVPIKHCAEIRRIARQASGHLINTNVSRYAATLSMRHTPLGETMAAAALAAQRLRVCVHDTVKRHSGSWDKPVIWVSAVVSCHSFSGSCVPSPQHVAPQSRSGMVHITVPSD